VIMEVALMLLLWVFPR